MANSKFPLYCILLLIFSMPLVSHAGTIFVAADGTGDYNCNGVNDEIEIQQALNTVAYFDTVYLRSGVYTLSDTLLIKGNTTLAGDSTAVLRFLNQNIWLSKPNLITVSSNVTIRGFKLDGNNIANGDYGTILYVPVEVTNISINKVNMYNQPQGGKTIKGGSCINSNGNNITISNSDIDGRVRLSGYAYVVNNNIKTLLNNGTNNSKIYNNIIDYLGVELGSCEIYNNIIYRLFCDADHRSYSPAGGRKGHIHHNMMKRSKPFPWSFISVSGTVATEDTVLIENNTFDTGWIEVTGRPWEPYQSGPDRKGTVVIRNNIMIITTGEQSHLPFINNGMQYSSDRIKIYSEYNCLYTTHERTYYRNSQYSYHPIYHHGDIYVDPLFADRENGDYHLKSNVGRWNGTEWVYDNVRSPCIAAGHPDSDYSNEPYPNGDRVNMGRYGNTPEASKSWSAEVTGEKPVSFSLSQNTPNPFNPQTTITFSIPHTSPVKLEIYDLTGRKVETLVNETKEMGTYTVDWKPADLASGMYLYRIVVGEYNETKKMVYIK